jgi:hypothetical protein
MLVRNLLLGVSLCTTLVTLNATVAWAQQAPTEAAPAEDVVRLKTGEVHRGVITVLTKGVSVELLMGGSTRKSFAWAEVEYAGPSGQMPASPPTPQTEPPQQPPPAAPAAPAPSAPSSQVTSSAAPMLPSASDAGGTQAENTPSSPDKSATTTMREYPHHRFQLAYFGGWAVDEHDVATVGYTDNLGTSGTETIKASFGGGNGGLLTYGYAVHELLELTASYGAQWKSNDNGLVDTAKGGFLSFVLLVGPQLDLPIYEAAPGVGVRLTLSGGPSFYHSPSLDTDLSEIPDGTDMVLTYAPALGWHGVAGIEYAGANPAGAGAAIGLRVGYYSVGYTLSSATDNGAAVAKDSIAKEFQSVSGDAIDLSLYVAFLL